MALPGIPGILFSIRPALWLQAANRATGTTLQQLSQVQTLNARKRRTDMQKWRCIICDYIYDPAEGDPGNGVAPGTPFEEIPEEWVCPICGVGKDQFEEV